MHEREETTVSGIVQGQGDISTKKIRMGLEEAQPDQVVDDDGLLRPEPVCAIILVSNLVILTEMM